jgi:hypothetical protein
VVARIWEWTLDIPNDHNPVGVSTTIHGAMEALSLTLIAIGIPSAGRVVSIAVHDSADGWNYERLETIATACHEKGVITWQKKKFLTLPSLSRQS